MRQVKVLMNNFEESSRLDLNVVQPSFPWKCMYAVLLSIINKSSLPRRKEYKVLGYLCSSLW